jgi:RNA polymerase sigma-70 factor (ECF subfamily)
MKTSEDKPNPMRDRLDGKQLEQLMRQHAAALELFAAQWTSAPEDCVQEAFLQLVRQRSVPDRVVPWLYRVVRNRAISMQRSRWRRRRREAALAETRNPWFDSSSCSAEEILDLTEALRSLPVELREIIVARIWGGLTFEEISSALGASISTTYRRYQDGLEAVRRKLEQPCRNPIRAIHE